MDEEVGSLSHFDELFWPDIDNFISQAPPRQPDNLVNLAGSSDSMFSTKTILLPTTLYAPDSSIPTPIITQSPNRFGFLHQDSNYTPQSSAILPVPDHDFLWYQEANIAFERNHPPPVLNHDEFLYQQPINSFQNNYPLPILDQLPSRQPETQLPTQKRAPKAPTMSNKTWEPHYSRIRQLYVKEGKSFENLREILNKELGINAT